jgi:ribosomal protein S27AE
MNCPKCKEGELLVLHTDSIECTGCGSTMNIDYCLCPNCQWACRMNNGKFLDEMAMTTESLGEVVEDLEELLSEGGPSTMTWAPESNVGSMLDLVHPCVKCGETMTAYDPETSEYECLMCGFKWEILSHE